MSPGRVSPPVLWSRWGAQTCGTVPPFIAGLPFFPQTVQQVLPGLNRRIEREMYAMMTYLANGRRRLG